MERMLLLETELVQEKHLLLFCQFWTDLVKAVTNKYQNTIQGFLLYFQLEN